MPDKAPLPASRNFDVDADGWETLPGYVTPASAVEPLRQIHQMLADVRSGRIVLPEMTPDEQLVFDRLTYYG